MWSNALRKLFPHGPPRIGAAHRTIVREDDWELMLTVAGNMDILLRLDPDIVRVISVGYGVTCEDVRSTADRIRMFFGLLQEDPIVEQEVVRECHVQHSQAWIARTLFMQVAQQRRGDRPLWQTILKEAC